MNGKLGSDRLVFYAILVIGLILLIPVSIILNKVVEYTVLGVEKMLCQPSSININVTYLNIAGMIGFIGLIVLIYGVYEYRRILLIRYKDKYVELVKTGSTISISGLAIIVFGDTFYMLIPPEPLTYSVSIFNPILLTASYIILVGLFVFVIGLLLLNGSIYVITMEKHGLVGVLPLIFTSIALIYILHIYTVLLLLITSTIISYILLKTS